MSSVAAPLLTDELLPPRGLRGRIGSVWASPTAWSLTDQAIASLGNFVTTLLVIRALTPHDSGLFGILLDITFFLNNVHAPLLTYPLSVRGATTDHNTTARLAVASLVLTALCGVLLICTGIVAGVMTHEIGPIIWSAVAAMLWQMQEVTRRALIARFRMRDAVIGDAISYLGQAIGVALLFHAGALTLDRLFITMAVTSAVALVVQVLQVGWQVLSPKEIRSYAVEFWNMGHWLLAGNLTGLICIPAFSWVLVYFHGLAAGSINLALLSLLKISHPVISAVANLIIPAVANANLKGRQQAFKAFIRYALLGGGLLLPLFGALVLVPTKLLRVVYAGSNAEVYAAYSTALQIMVISYILVYMANMTTAYLTGLQKTRDVFIGHAANTVGSLLIGLPMVAVWGVTGGAVGGGIAIAARLVTNTVSIRRAS